MRPPKPMPPRRQHYGIVLLFGLALAVAGSVAGQEPVGTNEGPPPTAKTETSLLRLETLGSGLIIWGSLAGFDEAIRDFVVRNQGSFGDDLASFGRDFGDWPVAGPIFVAGTVLVGIIDDGSVGARRGAAAAVGVLAGSMANEAINQVVGRRRPAEGFGPLEFDPFHGHSSFGSGHAAFAFAMAASVDEVTEGWVAAPFYGAAAVAALSRVYDDRHWFSDIVLGSLMGYLVGRQGARAATRAFGVDTNPTGPETDGALAWLARLEPVASAEFLGVRLRF